MTDMDEASDALRADGADSALVSSLIAEGQAAAGEDRSRGAKTKAKLKAAALEAFSELGWSPTRVQDIVSRAGVSHGTFYTYYKNKAVLLDELVRERMTHLIALGMQQWEAEDVRGALERVIGGFLDRYRQDAIVMRTWLQAARDEPSFGQLYRAARKIFIERVAQQVDATVQASGRAREFSAMTVASSLVAMVEHFAYCWLVLGEEHDRDEAVASLVLVWGSTLNTLAGFEVCDLKA